VRLLGEEGSERAAFLSGEPCTVAVQVESESMLAAPYLSYELHDDTGLLLAAGGEDTARLGWPEQPGERLLRLDIERLPVADGCFRLRFGLADGEGGPWYHLLDDAAELVVHPASDGRGALRLEGRWSMQEISVNGGIETE
jgi:hypothetical protein